MPKIKSLPPNTEGLQGADVLALHNDSTDDTEKVSVEQLRSHITWTPAEETWSYSSWSSTTRIGVITVPSNATAKYSAGMRIRITQSTGGTKYGIIHAVSSTSLTVFFASGYTLNNEAISNPYWSCVKVPFGFPASRRNFELETSTSGFTQSSPSASTWYNSSINLPVGIGMMLGWQANIFAIKTSGPIDISCTLSTTTNSETDADYTSRHYTTGVNESASPAGKQSGKVTAAAATYSLLIYTPQSSTSSIRLLGGASSGNTLISAVSAYI